MKRLLAAIAAMVVSGVALAQEAYPSKPIRMILPFPPGNPTDASGRLVAERMAGILGQPVVVENRAGAGGQVGVKQLADSRPDGYTFGMVSNGTNGAAGSVFSKLAYDPVGGFEFIGRYSTVAWVMAVKPDSPVKDVPGFLENARANPGKVTGNHHSGSSRLVLNMLKVRGKVDLVEVAYVNPLHIVADVGSGQLQFGILTTDMAVNFQKQGRIRLLGTTSAERIPELPDVPALSETLPGFEFVSWIGMAAPAGTPAPVMQKLKAAFFQALSQPDMKERMRVMGMTLLNDPKEDVAGLIREEAAFWSKHAKELGLAQAQ
ncbi:MAG: hypothetical protein RJA99_908 [Pseudomonadota bacterium]|jgi:tripartite-type tricarboxylate transporter receptor subunit TctC